MNFGSHDNFLSLSGIIRAGVTRYPVKDYASGSKFFCGRNLAHVTRKLKPCVQNVVVEKSGGKQ